MVTSVNLKTWEEKPILLIDTCPVVPAYRKDKVELGLPDWIQDPVKAIGALGRNYEINKRIFDYSFAEQFLRLRDALRTLRGKEALSAGCKLLALLEKEGLGREEV